MHVSWVLYHSTSLCLASFNTSKHAVCKRLQKVFLKSTALLFFLMNMTQHYKHIMIKQKKPYLFDSAFDFKHKTHSVWTTLYRSTSVCLVLQVIERMENSHKLNSDCYINKVTRNLNFYYMQWNIYKYIFVFIFLMLFKRWYDVK